MTQHQIAQQASQGVGCAPLTPLPFLGDWNVIFMFMVTFPVLATLTVRDECVLVSSIDRVRADGVLTLPDSEWNSLCSWWKKRFRLLNLLFQLCGLITGAAVVWSNYATYVHPCIGYWIAPSGSLLPVGYLYLFCIFLFYFVTSIYILRNIAISFFLRDLAAHSKISVLPLHPDHSGGLRPIGEVGLRNQYVLTVVGLNVVILKFIAVWYFPALHQLTDLIVAAILAYILFSPPLFIGPLLPFRAAMLDTRTTLMNEVARRLRIEIDAILQQLRAGQISKQDEDMVDRLSKLGTVIDQLPVWPFDLRTIQKFLTAYVAPAAGAVLLDLGKKWLEAGPIVLKLAPKISH